MRILALLGSGGLAPDFGLSHDEGAGVGLDVHLGKSGLKKGQANREGGAAATRDFHHAGEASSIGESQKRCGEMIDECDNNLADTNKFRLIPKEERLL
ncbi:hypothetical protein [Bosea sp. (in: a-proteobacteria)]|uniref:hypothetical protein n=1 Tax=Bosea sp. (in: a-proteobacteria) TaxID=1871050 RepID=UPI0031FE9E8E